jgi:hypothetical protein
LQYYSALVLEIRAIQYLWRNPVSHTRDNYDILQARSALDHIRAFTKSIAENELSASRRKK